MQDFIITQVSWDTQRAGAPESADAVGRRFGILVDFLQSNGLTTRVLLSPGDKVTDDFAIRASDLTDSGLELMKKGYDNWLRRIDRGGDPGDTRILDRALKRVRNSV